MLTRVGFGSVLAIQCCNPIGMTNSPGPVQGEEMLFNYGNIEGNNWAFNITDAEATAR